MPALDYPLEIEQGADYKRTVPVLGLTGDLTGWTVAGQIRGEHVSAPLLHTLDVTCVGSNVVLHVPAATSASWGWRTGRYDVELTDPDGVPVRLLQGPVTVSPEVTR